MVTMGVLDGKEGKGKGGDLSLPKQAQAFIREDVDGRASSCADALDCRCILGGNAGAGQGSVRVHGRGHGCPQRPIPTSDNDNDNDNEHECKVKVLATAEEQRASRYTKMLPRFNLHQPGSFLLLIFTAQRMHYEYNEYDHDYADDDTDYGPSTSYEPPPLSSAVLDTPITRVYGWN